jgi:hypothetical protein
MTNAPDDETEITDAEQAWMLELNRIGIEEQHGRFSPCNQPHCMAGLPS